MKNFEPGPALFCTISQNGGIFSVSYQATDNVTSANRSGYSAEMFETVPKGTPVIDYRTADSGEVLKAIMSTDGPREYCGRGVTLAEYLERMGATGATITKL